ncbi:MAG: ABC transporter ATP-binding protein [Clostridiales bacterium]|nr:ABC transporter ATP-binding protein [Clostridiales bacterium]
MVEGMSVYLFCHNKMGVLKRALDLMRPFASKLIPAELFLALSSLMYLLVPLFSRILIDDYLKPMTGTFQQISLLAVAMFLARALGEVIFIISSRVFNAASIQYSNHLRNLAYEKIQKLSMNSLSKRTPGDMIRRVMEDTATVREFVSDGGRWAVEQMITFLVVFVILILTDPQLTLLVFLPVPIVSIALSRFWRFIHIRYERQWRKNSKAQSILHDIIKGIRTVKSFGKEEVEIQKFSKATGELAQISSQNEATWALLFPIMTFFTGIGEFLVLYFGGHKILDGNLSFGVLVQFTMYITYIYAPLRWFVSFPRWLANAMTSMVKIFEILDEEPDIASIPNPKNVPVKGSLSFEGVTFGYKSYEPVLKGINFDINPGEMIGIVGRSGAGKSTMINLIMRLYDPGQGRITTNGVDIKDMDQEHLH